MTTIEQVIQAKENYKSIDIKLSNGKTMQVDFLTYNIIRYKPGVGCEQMRHFYGDTTKMVHLCKRYLKNQAEKKI
jgi:5-bromo-4-chloroindolyl phosphate hydrolysis protein